MSTYHTWYLSLAGFLLMAGPLSAQEAAPAPLKMVIAVWPDSTGAAGTIKHMSKSAKDQTEAYAVLVKRQDGTVEARERYHNPRGPGAGVQASDLIDRATTRMSEPPASAGDSASGYEASGKPSALSPEDLKRVQTMFGPGESALLLVSQAPAMSQIKRSLGIGAQRDVEIVELSVKE
jgi:hypothetical protein